MNEKIVKILNSKAMNSGILGKFKDWIYFRFISDRQEAHTDQYRDVILNDFYEIYQDAPWFLGFGSFLRFIRDHTMEGQDVDILLFYEDYVKGKEELQKRGYSLYGEFYDRNGRITEQKLLYENVELDIFFVFQDQDRYYYASSYEDETKKDQIIREVEGNKRIVRGEGYCSFYKEIPDMEVETYVYKGTKFKGYKNYDAHLTAEYDNWKNPDPKYDPLEEHEDNPFIKVPNAKNVYYYKEPLKKF